MIFFSCYITSQDIGDNLMTIKRLMMRKVKSWWWIILQVKQIRCLTIDESFPKLMLTQQVSKGLLLFIFQFSFMCHIQLLWLLIVYNIYGFWMKYDMSWKPQDLVSQQNLNPPKLHTRREAARQSPLDYSNVKPQTKLGSYECRVVSFTQTCQTYWNITIIAYYHHYINSRQPPH